MRRSFILTLIFLLSPLLLHGQFLRTAGEVVRATQEGSEAMEKLADLHDALQEFQLGKQPKALGNWDGVAQNLETSAKQVERLSLTQTPQTRISVPTSFDALCSPAFSASIFSLAREYDMAINDADEASSRLKSQKAIAKRLWPKLNEISDLYLALSDIPEFGNIFQWDWFDIETDVKGKLIQYESAVETKLAAFEIKAAALRTQASNLASNSSTMRIECSNEARRQSEKAAAEAEARRKAEAEARRKAEAEARRKAEAEATRKAASAQRENAKVDISGTWLHAGTSNVFSVSRSGDQLYFSGPPYWGSDGKGSYTGNDSFSMIWPKLNLSFAAKVSQDGRTINWNNGVVWKKQ